MTAPKLPTPPAPPTRAELATLLRAMKIHFAASTNRDEQALYDRATDYADALDVDDLALVTNAAKALRAADCELMPRRVPYADLNELDQGTYRNTARVALRAAGVIA